ncbi:hypothetical protein CcaverHIS002_0301580 [Cutaneotrichosporon cavernicola]|nr:hypothetical protein CcaverHIS002_0301580 [Cutaneotrichosporon cavernicola]
MMSYTLYISISAGTGFCYGSICRGGDAKWDDLKDSQRGLRWRSTVLWVVEGQGELNDVVAYVSPEHVKGGAHTLQTFFPIMSTPVLAASANWMLLLTLFLDSGRTVEDLKRVLDPKFLGPEKKPRRIHVPSAVENKFLVQGRRPDQTPTMKSVNLVLKSVSRLSGFDGDVTTHCFRHLIGDEVYEKRGFEATRRTLQHKKTTSTRYYISPVLPSYVTQALFDDPDGSPLAKRLRRATSKPDSNAPIPANLALDKERLNNLKEDCELVGLLAEQQQIKGTIVESYGTITAAPEEKQRQYRSCARRYRDRLGQLCEVEFKELRDQYFDTKQRSILPPVDPNSSSTTSSSSTKRPHVATTSAEEEIDRISEDDPTFNVDLDIVNFAIEQATAEDTGLTCHDDEAVEKDVQEEDDEDDASVIAGLMGGPCCNILKLAELILA